MILKISDLNNLEKQHYLQHLIVPRPICFASTIDAHEQVNLSPFSFFNVFSTNPAIVVFSPVRRVRNNTTKHTLENLLEVPEVAINLVDYEMVQQVSLASCEFPKDTNEFLKAGFTMKPAVSIRPPLVQESKANLECKVLEIKSLGQEGGAGNLVICEVLQIHIDSSILDASHKIDQRKFEPVARLGGNWYCRVNGENLFEVEKPNVLLGMGLDALPFEIRTSSVFTGNDLGALANLTAPPKKDIQFQDPDLAPILLMEPGEARTRSLHVCAKKWIAQGAIANAWQVLLAIP